MVDKSKYGNEVVTNFMKIGDPDDVADGDEFVIVKSLEGTLVESGTMNINGNAVGRYKVATEDGEATFIGTTMIDDKMSGIEIGTEFLIEFDGYKASKGAGRSPMKQVRVYTV